MVLKSKLAWILVGLYGVFVFYSLFQTLFISDHWFFIIFPAMPWFLVFNVSDITSDAIARIVLVIFIVINMILIYVIGEGIEKLFKRTR